MVENGVISYANLRKVQLTVEDLLMLLRQKSIWNLSVLHQACLEPTGEVSVLKKQEYAPVTAQDMSITTPQPLTNPPQQVDFQEQDNEKLGYVINTDGSKTPIRKG